MTLEAVARRRREQVQWQRRRRLERQLHDGAALRVSALALQLGLFRHKVPPAEHALRDAIDAVQDELHAVLQELRAVAAQIYPPLLDEAGLGPALRELGEQLDVVVRVAERPAVPPTVVDGVWRGPAVAPLDPAAPLQPVGVEACRPAHAFHSAGAGPEAFAVSTPPAPVEPVASVAPDEPVARCPRSGTANRFGAAAEGAVYFALVDWLSAGRPGDPVDIELRREGDELVVTIRVPLAPGSDVPAGTGHEEGAIGGAAALAELLADRARPLGGVVRRLPASTCACSPRADGMIVVRIPCE